MIIKGNTVGTPMPRADYAETDPRKASFIKNKPDADIKLAKDTAAVAKTTADEAKATAGVAKSTADNATSVADEAKTTANEAKSTADSAQTTAGEAKSTADNAKTVADAARDTADSAKTTANNALSKGGGEMTGAVKLKGIHLTEGVDYGDTFPENAEVGRLFWIPVVKADG